MIRIHAAHKDINNAFMLLDVRDFSALLPSQKKAKIFFEYFDFYLVKRFLKWPIMEDFEEIF